MADPATKPYPDVVYQRMRHILMSYRNLRSSETGARYDWANLVDEIAVYCDAYFPKNSLENFVRGWHEDPRETDKKRLRPDTASSTLIHKFSIPKADRVEAIIEFLTNPESRGFFCSRDVLLSTSKMQAPYFLQHYLDNECEQPDFHETNTNPAAFHCNYRWDDPDQLRDFSLQILSPLANGAAFVDVLEKPRSETVTPICEPLSPGTATVHSGWAVHSRQQQTLFVFVKHIRDMSTVFYLALGYGSRSAQRPFPDSLVLLEHRMPEPECPDEPGQNNPQTLDTLKKQLQDSIYTLTLEAIPHRKR